MAAERLEKEREIASQVRAERKLTSTEEERRRVEAEAEKARKKAEEERRKEEEEQQARLAAESTMDSSADSMDLWNNIMGQMSA